MRRDVLVRILHGEEGLSTIFPLLTFVGFEPEGEDGAILVLRGHATTEPTAPGDEQKLSGKGETKTPDAALLLFDGPAGVASPSEGGAAAGAPLRAQEGPQEDQQTSGGKSSKPLPPDGSVIDVADYVDPPPKGHVQPEFFQPRSSKDGARTGAEGEGVIVGKNKAHDESVDTIWSAPANGTNAASANDPVVEEGNPPMNSSSAPRTTQIQSLPERLNFVLKLLEEQEIAERDPETFVFSEVIHYVQADVKLPGIVAKDDFPPPQAFKETAEKPWDRVSTRPKKPWELARERAGHGESRGVEPIEDMMEEDGRGGGAGVGVVGGMASEGVMEKVVEP